MQFGAAVLVEPGDWGILGDIAARAEDAGWDYVFCAEGPYAGFTNSIVGSAVMAESTSRITVGTCISIVHYRHPWTAAAAAGNMRERTGGRYVFGLGVSHPSINNPIGIDIPRPLAATRRYVREIRRFADQMPWGQPEIWLAAVLEPMARVAGEVGDGVIFHHVPLRSLPETIAAVEEAAGPDRPRPKVAAYARIACGDDAAETWERARGIAYEFYKFPIYQRLYRQAGFVEETDQVVAATVRGDRAAAYEALTEELLDDFLIVGDAERCRAKLEEFGEAGVDVMLYAPIPLKGPLEQRFGPLFEPFKVATRV
jgi:alkanesulfonate monooxygenase SsuD/methylene tetrahydromethanopterin reductase-like flavin-dependent oxidoreductase (luciferase family)